MRGISPALRGMCAGSCRPCGACGAAAAAVRTSRRPSRWPQLAVQASAPLPVLPPLRGDPWSWSWGNGMAPAAVERASARGRTVECAATLSSTPGWARVGLAMAVTAACRRPLLASGRLWGGPHTSMMMTMRRWLRQSERCPWLLAVVCGRASWWQMPIWTVSSERCRPRWRASRRWLWTSMRWITRRRTPHGYQLLPAPVLARRHRRRGGQRRTATPAA